MSITEAIALLNKDSTGREEGRGEKQSLTEKIYGWPMQRGQWCLQRLKLPALKKCKPKDAIEYIGIAADEPKRFGNLSDKKKSPLVEIG